MPDDLHLLPALRSGSPAAFAELFERYSDRMYRLAAGLLQDENEAEDVVQEAFLRFIEKLDVFRGDARIGTWLYRTVHNSSIDRLRKTRRVVDIPEEDLDLPIPDVFVDWRHVPEKVLTEDEVSEYLDRAIHSLPETLRAVFLLREIEELTTQETADVLSLSAGAVKVRLHRGRLMLRSRLSEYFSEWSEAEEVRDEG